MGATCAGYLHHLQCILFILIQGRLLGKTNIPNYLRIQEYYQTQHYLKVDPLNTKNLDDHVKSK